jgi:hypothetical protein
MARRKRRKPPPEKTRTGPSHTGSLVIVVLLMVTILAFLHFSAEDRSWQEYIGAGDRALSRGNYDWAEKMYGEALQYAQNKGDDDPLVAKTRRYLQRLEKARGR